MNKPTSNFPRNAPFRSTLSLCERWLSEMNIRGVVERRDPSIQLAYICDGLPPALSYMGIPITQISDSPIEGADAIDVHNAAVRLLAVAVKAHFFLFKLDLLVGEPFFFWVPDLSRPQKPRFGLCYPLLKNRRCVVVSEADLSLLTQGRLALGRFPVILPSDHNRWLDIKLWNSLEEEARLARQSRDSEDPSLERAPATPNLPAQIFPLGRLLDVPSEMKAMARSAGLRFSDSHKSFYLPKGFDPLPVEEWLSFHRKRIELAKSLSMTSDTDAIWMQ